MRNCQREIRFIIHSHDSHTCFDSTVVSTILMRVRPPFRPTESEIIKQPASQPVRISKSNVPHWQQSHDMCAHVRICVVTANKSSGHLPNLWVCDVPTKKRSFVCQKSRARTFGGIYVGHIVRPTVAEPLLRDIEERSW